MIRNLTFITRSPNTELLTRPDWNKGAGVTLRGFPHFPHGEGQAAAAMGEFGLGL